MTSVLSRENTIDKGNINNKLIGVDKINIVNDNIYIKIKCKKYTKAN